MRAHPQPSSREHAAGRATRMRMLVAIGVLIALLHVGSDAILWRALLPVGLIALGLDLMTEGRQRRRIVPAALAVLALLMPLVGVSHMVDRREIARPQPGLEAGVITDNIDRLHATLKLTAGSLRIDALDDGRDQGVVAQIEPAHDFERAYRRDGQRGLLEVSSGPLAGGDYHLRVTPDVPLDLSVEMGAGDVGPLDFTDTHLQRLDLRLGAGSATLRLPDRGAMQINVTSSVGEVTIDVPADLAARIEVRSRIGDVAVADRFALRDGAYVTDNYAPDAPDRADITITSSLGSVRVR